MPSTPFSTATVATAGAWTGRVRDTPPGLRAYWLGQPGAMIQLPAPKVGREVTTSSGESVHTSADGTTSVFRRAGQPKRRFVLEWDRLAGRDLQVVQGFYRRIFGAGPWAYLPPEDVNRLQEATSLSADPSAWGANAGTLIADTAATPIAPAGVLRWTPTASGQILYAAPSAGAGFDTDDLTPYLPSEPLTVSLWAWVGTGTRTVTFRAAGFTTTGLGSNVDASITLTTTPQRFTLTVPAGNLATAALTTAALVAGSGSPPILVSAPQLEYASTATGYALGKGVPRVVWTDPPDQTLDARLRAATSMTLAE